MKRIVVEQAFESASAAAASEESHAAHAEAMAAKGIRRLRRFPSRDGRTAIAEYEAPSAEAVEAALSSGGIAYERVWSGTAFDWESERNG